MLPIDSFSGNGIVRSVFSTAERTSILRFQLSGDHVFGCSCLVPCFCPQTFTQVADLMTYHQLSGIPWIRPISKGPRTAGEKGPVSEGSHCPSSCQELIGPGNAAQCTNFFEDSLGWWLIVGWFGLLKPVTLVIQ